MESGVLTRGNEPSHASCGDAPKTSKPKTKQLCWGTKLLSASSLPMAAAAPLQLWQTCHFHRPRLVSPFLLGQNYAGQEGIGSGKVEHHKVKRWCQSVKLQRSWAMYHIGCNLANVAIFFELVQRKQVVVGSRWPPLTMLKDRYVNVFVGNEIDILCNIK